jgi:tetratricopeptide (TPR) repeat protein
VQEAREHARAAVEAFERGPERERLASAYRFYQILSEVFGDWCEARRWSDRALRSWPDYLEALAGRVLLECDLGNTDEVEAYLERMVEFSRRPGLEETQHDLPLAEVILLVGRIQGDTRRFDMAGAIARRVLAAPRSNEWDVRARMNLALMAAVEGDAEGARELYSVLEARYRPMPGWHSHQAPGRLLGLVAHGAGMLNEAVEHLEGSLAFCRAGGYLPQLAWTCCDYADLLLERDSAGDYEKAMELLEEGLAIARDLRMRPLVERILVRRRTSRG